jgi:SAM-dependent methyltransferase
MASPLLHESHLQRLARRYDTDKADHTHYLRNYEENFSNLLDRNVRLLELGVKTGGSLLLWRDYFPRGLIVGLDINPVQIEDQSARIRTYQGKQDDTRLLDRIASETAREGFDIIIDDCSHIGVLSRVSFWHLFDNHLKSGGLYIIEDWGTGYWDNWVDGVSYTPGKRTFNRSFYRLTRGIARLQQNRVLGRTPVVKGFLRRAKAAVLKREYHPHDYGMVGFVKELVDELGMADITKTTAEGSRVHSKFREMRFYHSHLFVTKA